MVHEIIKMECHVEIGNYTLCIREIAIEIHPAFYNINIIYLLQQQHTSIKGDTTIDGMTHRWYGNS